MIPQEVYDRIDAVIEKNSSHEKIIIFLAVLIFILGVSLFIYGVYKEEVWIVAPSTLFTAALYWPVNLIREIRKENIALAAVPALISTLPPEEAARELVKLLEKLS